VLLVAVSKTKPVSDILEAYQFGQKVFGENKVQEMVDKYHQLPKDIQWHMIGNLQRNKVKYIASFVSLIHGADSFKLLQEINKQAIINNRVIDCLVQIKISEEDTKHGMSFFEAKTMIASEEFQSLKNIKIVGLMGMASFTEDKNSIRQEFKSLSDFFIDFKELTSSQISLQVLSMGMSSDYKIAIEQGSNMIRLGSVIFGKRFI
jgi:hypothetical protein